MIFQLEWFGNISKGYRLKIVMPFLLNIIAVCASLLFVEYTQKLLSCYNSTLDVMYTFIMILIVIKIIQLIAEQLEVIIREKTALQILSVDSPRKSVSQILSCNGTLFKIIV